MGKSSSMMHMPTEADKILNSMGDSPTEEGTIQSTYMAMKNIRETYLTRARRCASLTIPTLLSQEESQDYTTEYPTPYQSLGAAAVNSLAAKLLLTLLPSDTPFFKYSLDPMVLKGIQEEALEARLDPTQVEELLYATENKADAAFSLREQAIQDYIEQSTIRIDSHEVFKHLLVSGNCLVFLPPKGNKGLLGIKQEKRKEDSLKVYRLDQYVVKRAVDGTLLRIIIEEKTSPLALPAPLRDLIGASPSPDQNPLGTHEDTVEIYTQIERQENGSWEVNQEVAGHVIEESKGTYKADELPFLALRCVPMNNEDYGRGRVEEYLGDLITLEGLCQALCEGTAATAKLLVMVNPSGVTKRQEVAKAANGAVIAGREEDVQFLHSNKQADFNTAEQAIVRITQNLSQAFLMNSSIQRDAERVTAVEIQYMAQELETNLGGMYSLFSREWQYPLLQLVEQKMDKEKLLAEIPEEWIKTSIVTGVQALGRGHELMQLQTFLSSITQTLGPEVVASYINIEAVLDRTATALGIKTTGLIKSQEQIAQEKQQAQQQQMMQQLGPEGLKQAGAMMQQQNGADISQEEQLMAQEHERSMQAEAAPPQQGGQETDG